MKQRKKLKSQFTPIIYHLKPYVKSISSSESSTERKEYETESETIDDVSDLELKSLTFKTNNISTRPDMETPVTICCSQIPLSSRSEETLTDDSNSKYCDSYCLSDMNGGKSIQESIFLSSYDKGKSRTQQQQQQKRQVDSLLLPTDYMNLYQNPQTNIEYVNPTVTNQINLRKVSKTNSIQPASNKMKPTSYQEKSFSGKNQTKYHLKCYENSGRLKNQVTTPLITKNSLNRHVGLRLNLKMDVAKSTTVKNPIKFDQCISTNHGSGKKLKSVPRHCSMLNLSNNSLKNRKFSSSLDSLQQSIKDHDTDCLDSSTTLISDGVNNENDESQAEECLNTSDNDDRISQTIEFNKSTAQNKKNDRKPSFRRCQSVAGYKNTNSCLPGYKRMNRYSYRSFSQDLLCSRNQNKLPPKSLYGQRKAKINKDSTGNHSDQKRCHHLSSSSKLSSKSQPRKVSSRSNSGIRNSSKSRNKSVDKSYYDNLNDNISINHTKLDYHHERPMHAANSTNRRTTLRSQSPIKNTMRRDLDYNRSVHAPISYFLDFNNKSNSNQHSEYCPINNPEYADNVPKQSYTMEQEIENNSREHELHSRNIHSCRNNLHALFPNTSCHRHIDVSSRSLNRLRRRCHSIERELNSIERDKYRKNQYNPLSSDPRIDALTSANRILHQRLYDIQKLQENREYALNKAHTMVNSLLNKVDDDHNDKSYPTNSYKPTTIKEDSLQLPSYTPTKYGHYCHLHHHPHHQHHHHKANQEIIDYHDRKYDNYLPVNNNNNNYCLNQSTLLYSKNNPANLLLEKLRADYADLANSVCRVEAKARDAASAVQTLLRQFQMGLMEPIELNSANQLPSTDLCEPFHKESHSNELYDKSVAYRLQKTRDTLDQLKSDSFRPSINYSKQSDYTVPLTISVTTTTMPTPTIINSLTTSSVPVTVTSSGMVPSKMNLHNLHEPYVYNRPYGNLFRSTWHVS
ncbi:unnamed protein product [Schistosoma turkestanicum]|nr:unnamed protein product [Schistosoma turkestanicum]